MKAADPAVPEGRCTDCATAKPPAGALVCQGCRMLRIMGIPMTPYTPADHTEAQA